MAADLRRHLKALAVVGPLLVEQLVGRRRAVLALGQLLQERLEVAARLALGRQLDFGPDRVGDEPPGGGIPAVEVDGRDQRLEHVGQQRRRHARVGHHPLAEDEELLHPQRLAQLRAGLAADDDRLDSGHVSFEIFGILPEENLADHRPQDRVAEKLQPFVGSQAVFRARGVRHRRYQQAPILELVADPPLKLLHQETLRRLERV